MVRTRKKFFLDFVDLPRRKYWIQKIWSKNPSQFFFKKKTFFSRHVQKRNKNFQKKKIFDQNFFFFDFFFPKNFSKMVIKSDWVQDFLWIFFFNRPVFSNTACEHQKKVNFTLNTCDNGPILDDYRPSQRPNRILAGAGLKNPKNNFFLVRTNFSYVFGGVKNINGGIPGYRYILKEPSVDVTSVAPRCDSLSMLNINKRFFDLVSMMLLVRKWVKNSKLRWSGF